MLEEAEKLEIKNLNISRKQFSLFQVLAMELFVV